jgi:hypothetical protein
MTKPVDLFIRFVFFIKLLYMFSSVYAFYLISKKQENTEIYHRVEYWKERFKFIFKICMSALIAYYFSPLTGNTLKFDNETKFLFFVFGLILLTDVNWKLFFKQSVWFTMLQKAV